MGDYIISCVSVLCAVLFYQIYYYQVSFQIGFFKTDIHFFFLFLFLSVYRVPRARRERRPYGIFSYIRHVYNTNNASWIYLLDFCEVELIFMFWSFSRFPAHRTMPFVLIVSWFLIRSVPLYHFRSLIHTIVFPVILPADIRESRFCCKLSVSFDYTLQTRIHNNNNNNAISAPHCSSFIWKRFIRYNFPPFRVYDFSLCFIINIRKNYFSPPGGHLPYRYARYPLQPYYRSGDFMYARYKLYRDSTRYSPASHSCGEYARDSQLPRVL